MVGIFCYPEVQFNLSPSDYGKKPILIELTKERESRTKNETMLAIRPDEFMVFDIIPLNFITVLQTLRSSYFTVNILIK